MLTRRGLTLTSSLQMLSKCMLFSERCSLRRRQGLGVRRKGEACGILTPPCPHYPPPLSCMHTVYIYRENTPPCIIDPCFATDKGWTYVVNERHVTFHPPTTRPRFLVCILYIFIYDAMSLLVCKVLASPPTRLNPPPMSRP